jgi:thiamine biosynthesis protein ThiS
LAAPVVVEQTVTIQVNGKPVTLPDGATVAQLIESLDLGRQRVAVEVNLQLVLRKDWPAARLKEGDRVEVVTLVGGG